MKKALSIVNTLLLLLIISCTAMAAEKPNLSGTWQLDSERTEGLPPGIDQIMTIKQQDEKLELVTKVILPDGQVQDVPDTYNLNGKELDFQPKTFDGDQGKGKRTAKWTNNGLEVVETAEFANGVAIKMTRKWTVSADGKEIQIELNQVGPQGTIITKRTFTKKS